MLTHAATDFILKRTASGIVAGSGTVSLCGFGVAQTRVAREKRQRQENQDRVSNLATLFLDPVAFQNHLGDSNCGKRTLDIPVGWENFGVDGRSFFLRKIGLDWLKKNDSRAMH